MIPLPSLLVFECHPSLFGGKSVVDKDIENANHNESTNRQHKRRRNNISKRRDPTMETNALPLSPPSPLRLRRIQKVDPPRYQGNHHLAAAPFWERQQQEEEEQRSPRKHTVASIKRQSQLFAFVVTLASFVAVDTYSLLPAGTIIYAVALSMAWENWEREEQENLRYLEKLRKYHEQMEKVEREIQKAQFEYHVLRNQPHVDIMAVRRTPKRAPSTNGQDFDPANDHWIVYADEKKKGRRPPPPPHRLGPPRQLGSNVERRKN